MTTTSVVLLVAISSALSTIFGGVAYEVEINEYRYADWVVVVIGIGYLMILGSGLVALVWAVVRGIF